ncbi:MAG TPA: response regulator, partial [Polyangia bacterium]
TTFALLLPETTMTVDVVQPAPSPAPAHGETILIVDDEPAVRDAVARTLRRHHYRVLEAESAAEARVTLATEGAVVKLILLDQSMPQESGPEALPSLKRLTEAPVALFTGGLGELPPGAAALLEKPLVGAELLRTVRALLDETSVRVPQ